MRKYIALAPGRKGNLMDNNGKFNALLNSCAHTRKVYNALLAFAKPSIQQSDDVREKRQILIRELLSLFDKTECNK